MMRLEQIEEEEKIEEKEKKKKGKDEMRIEERRDGRR